MFKTRSTFVARGPQSHKDVRAQLEPALLIDRCASRQRSETSSNLTGEPLCVFESVLWKEFCYKIISFKSEEGPPRESISTDYRTTVGPIVTTDLERSSSSVVYLFSCPVQHLTTPGKILVSLS